MNETTGEIEDDNPMLVAISVGDSVLWNEEKERRRQAKQKREEHEALYKRGEGDRFYFIRSDEGFDDLRAATVTKLIYLSTFVSYKDGLLMYKKGKPMERKHLPEVLGLSTGGAHKFWHEVSPTYITQNEDNHLVLNTEKFVRGRLKHKEFMPYRQFYDKGVRTLYIASEGNYHKQLGYLFNLLPYINVEWNLVCNNSYETDIDKVDLLSVAEFCELIDYDINNIDRLLKVYNTVRFDVNGKHQRFCSFVYDGVDKQKAKICINPSILYTGSNKNRVEVLKLFFKED